MIYYHNNYFIIHKKNTTQNYYYKIHEIWNTQFEFQQNHQFITNRQVVDFINTKLKSGPHYYDTWEEGEYIQEFIDNVFKNVDDEVNLIYDTTYNNIQSYVGQTIWFQGTDPYMCLMDNSIEISYEARHYKTSLNSILLFWPYKIEDFKNNKMTLTCIKYD